ncbi:Pentapeptide repeats (8 copies) [compost metagenome]
MLNHSSFYQLDIRKTVFKNCRLQEVDFTEANLSNSFFDDSNLTNAVFDRTILDQANLKNAINYSINPNKNQLKKTKFAKDNLAGLLDQLQIIID